MRVKYFREIDEIVKIGGEWVLFTKGVSEDIPEKLATRFLSIPSYSKVASAIEIDPSKSISGESVEIVIENQPEPIIVEVVSSEPAEIVSAPTKTKTIRKKK